MDTNAATKAELLKYLNGRYIITADGNKHLIIGGKFQSRSGLVRLSELSAQWIREYARQSTAE